MLAQEDVRERSRIEDIIFNKEHSAIFVAAGSEGIDVYLFDQNNDLKYLKTITGEMV